MRVLWLKIKFNKNIKTKNIFYPLLNHKQPNKPGRCIVSVHRLGRICSGNLPSYTSK